MSAENVPVDAREVIKNALTDFEGQDNFSESGVTEIALNLAFAHIIGDALRYRTENHCEQFINDPTSFLPDFREATDRLKLTATHAFCCGTPEDYVALKHFAGIYLTLDLKMPQELKHFTVRVLQGAPAPLRKSRMPSETYLIRDAMVRVAVAQTRALGYKQKDAIEWTVAVYKTLGKGKTLSVSAVSHILKATRPAVNKKNRFQRPCNTVSATLEEARSMLRVIDTYIVALTSKMPR